MNLRGLALVLAVAVAVAAIGLPTSAQSAVRVFVDGDQVIFDQPPVISGSRVSANRWGPAWSGVRRAARC